MTPTGLPLPKPYLILLPTPKPVIVVLGKLGDSTDISNRLCERIRFHADFLHIHGSLGMKKPPVDSHLVSGLLIFLCTWGLYDDQEYNVCDQHPQGACLHLPWVKPSGHIISPPRVGRTYGSWTHFHDTMEHRTITPKSMAHPGGTDFVLGLPQIPYLWLHVKKYQQKGPPTLTLSGNAVRFHTTMAALTQYMCRPGLLPRIYAEGRPVWRLYVNLDQIKGFTSPWLHHTTITHWRVFPQQVTDIPPNGVCWYFYIFFHELDSSRSCQNNLGRLPLSEPARIGQYFQPSAWHRRHKWSARWPSIWGPRHLHFQPLHETSNGIPLWPPTLRWILCQQFYHTWTGRDYQILTGKPSLTFLHSPDFQYKGFYRYLTSGS